MSLDGQRIVVLSCIHRLRRNIILPQPWKEIRMEDLACMARGHRQFCQSVIAMYCRTSGDMNVNTAWMILFSQMSRNIDNIPPTQAALDQHIKRSSYQSGHVWGQSLEVQPELSDVNYWGWETSQTAGYIPK